MSVRVYMWVVTRANTYTHNTSWLCSATISASRVRARSERGVMPLPTSARRSLTEVLDTLG